MYNRCRIIALFCAFGMMGLTVNPVAIARAEMPKVEDVRLETDSDESDQASGVFIDLDEQAAEASQEAPADTAEASEVTEEEDDIVRAQQMLIDLGYLNGTADGLFGPMTSDALRRFQQGRGLEATGTLDDETLQLLAETAAATSDARAVQQRLIDLGYLKGSADGAFGEKSQSAMRQFQAVHGLEATGLPDDASRAALFSDAARALPTRLPSGSKGERVEELQNKLIQYGFLSGEADGAYGMNTSAAVKRFQRHLEAQGLSEALGIEPSGEATSMTLLTLYDPNYSSYLKDVAAGDDDDEVKRIERRLVGLGYMDAEPDTVLDDYAVEAAAAFQAAAGLETGEYGETFINALFSSKAPVADHYVLHDIVYGDESEAVREVQELLVCGGMTVSMPDGIYGDSFAKGMESLHEYLADRGDPSAFLFEDAKVVTIEAQNRLLNGLLSDLPGIYMASDETMTRRIQRRLHTLYFLSRSGIDGRYGKATQNALKDFQQINGLSATGNVDTQSLNRLFSPEAAYKPYPYRVEVSIAKQRVYVWQMNEAGEYEQVQTFVCSTGLGNSTPRGIFLDGGPANVWHHFSKFDVWARYSFEIEGDIMFHSVLFSEKDPDTLREGSLYALGQKASHGCVRLSVKNARWLFENCRKGSLVIIIQ